ncbi:MAG: dCTP deaminase [Planctomycetaceae bacterium]|nr:dCTP deaminase [Planctomycetaceae bacterium]
MILSNVELHLALDNGRLTISPEPIPRFPEIEGGHCPFDTHSVDLRLGDEIRVPKPGSYAYDHTQPASLAEHLSRNSVLYTISEQTPFKLEPHQFVLGVTLETVGLPIIEGRDTCLAARIEGKSSRARTALLIHFTAPTVHPGWDGRLVLEMINLGACPILLTPMMYIAQLIVEEVKGIPRRSDSQFQNQATAAGLPRRDILSNASESIQENGA